MNADAAVRAADEKAGSIFLEMGSDKWLVLRILLSGGGETYLWDERFGSYPSSIHYDRTLSTACTFTLTAGTEHRHLYLSTLSSNFPLPQYVPEGATYTVITNHMRAVPLSNDNVTGIWLTKCF